MRYSIDTNTCVAFLRQGAESPVARRLAATNPAEVVVCSVVRAELVYGARMSRDVEKNIEKVRRFVAAFASVGFDNAAADEYGQIRAELAAKGSPIGPNDLMIAAIAKSRGVVLVTHNVREFSRVHGLTLEDWQARPRPKPSEDVA